MKPLHTACTSNTGQFLMPSLACRMHAVLGKIMSGVVVATMMSPISCGAIPAASIALRLALSARSLECLVVGRDKALTDAGARHDPFVRGVDDLLKVVIGQHFGRQVTAACRRCARTSRHLPLAVPDMRSVM